MHLIDRVMARLVRSDGLVEGEAVPLHALFLARSHSPLQSRQRAHLIISRVRMIAAALALLTLLWAGVDAAVFGRGLWLPLAVLRLFTAAAFTVLAFAHRHSERLADAYRSLLLLMLIPSLFFLYAQSLLSLGNSDTANLAVISAYVYLPFMVVAGLSMFPLTALEGVTFALPILLAQLAVGLTHPALVPQGSNLGALWLLALIACIATLSAMNQLQFMIALVNQSVHDPLTGCYNRRSGEALLELQYHIAQRQQTPLAVAFIDLDDFKQINDRYGHDVGDRILHDTAEALRGTLRAGDILLRWGGEEFIAILPNTDCAAAREAFARLYAGGLLLRPDGSRLTVSIGIAELRADVATDWRNLVVQADHRMYAAKRAGKNRCVSCRDAAMRAVPSPPTPLPHAAPSPPSPLPHAGEG